MIRVRYLELVGDIDVRIAIERVVRGGSDENRDEVRGIRDDVSVEQNIL